MTEAVATPGKANGSLIPKPNAIIFLRMSIDVAENFASAIWQRTIQPRRSDLEPAAARALLRLKFSRADLDRADELALKAAAGQLTAAEERELEDYRTVATALEFLKSKARRSLKRVAA